LSKENDFDFTKENMWDYDFKKKIVMVLQKNKLKKTCCLVGIRTQESLNRWKQYIQIKTQTSIKSQLHKKDV
jgi:predicted phosphoadenosine phosphosulfate sulfurtransferase